MEQIMEAYYANDARKLRKVSDKVLCKLKFYDVDKDEFYSLADEIFFDAVRRYDGKRSFDGFLYFCLMNKFKTEMTRCNRQKRKADKESISIESPISEDSTTTVGETIADKKTIESEFFGENKEAFSPEMQRYLEKLSPLQRTVLHLISIGYTPNEILGELHINKKLYDDCYNAIHAYRNIEILM